MGRTTTEAPVGAIDAAIASSIEPSALAQTPEVLHVIPEFAPSAAVEPVETRFFNAETGQEVSADQIISTEEPKKSEDVALASDAVLGQGAMNDVTTTTVVPPPVLHKKTMLESAIEHFSGLSDQEKVESWRSFAQMLRESGIRGGVAFMNAYAENFGTEKPVHRQLMVPQTLWNACFADIPAEVIKPLADELEAYDKEAYEKFLRG